MQHVGADLAPGVRTRAAAGVLLAYRGDSRIAELTTEQDARALAARLDAMQDRIDELQQEQNRRAFRALAVRGAA